jgi:PAS domain-containing protein
MASPLEQFQEIQDSVLGKILADFPHPAAATDTHGQVVWANATFEQRYGHSVVESVGRLESDLHQPILDPAGLESRRHHLAVLNLPWSGSCRIRHSSGKTDEVRCFAIPLQCLSGVPSQAVLSLYGSPAAPELPCDALITHLVKTCFKLGVEAALHASPDSAFLAMHRGSRQQEIQRLVELNYSTKEVASLLKISPSTVNVVRWKLGLSRRKRRKIPPPPEKWAGWNVRGQTT